MALVAAALACALVAAGCGGSSSSGSGDSSSPSKFEFVGKADAACAKGNKEVKTKYAAFLKENKITKATENEESPAELKKSQAEVIETIAIPAYKQQAKEISALGAPSGDEDAVNAFADAVGEGIKKAEEDPVGVFTGTSKPFAKADKLAKEYGFKVCGNG